MPSKFTPTTKRNPCPICSDTSGDCRTTDGEMLLCHSLPDGGDHSLYKWIKSTDDGIWGIFVPRKEDGDRSIDSRRQWLELQRQRQERLEQQAREFNNGLSSAQRDKAIRLLSRHYGLNSSHRQQLRDRGLTDAQIDESHFFSVYPWAAAPPGIDEKCPGIKNGKLWTGATGYACPAFNSRGEAIGFQVRDENPEAQNKYLWAKGNFSSHLKIGELPLSVSGRVGMTVLLCEGILKPRIASYRLQNQFVIGAAGGNFGGSPLQLRSAIGACRRIVIAPDAGDILNPHVLRRIESTLSLFNFTYRVRIAWWGQVEKSAPDIDELSGWGNVQFLTASQWGQLVKDIGGNF